MDEPPSKSPVLEGIEHHYKTVNGIKLHYVAQGAGDLILFLHGFPEFWYSWRKQIPFFAENYKAVAPDLRGYNDSDKPRGIKHYHADIIAEDLRQLIIALGYEKAIVVAHDWGGGVAYALAQNSPEVVDKLIALNCPLPKILMKHLFTNPSQLKKSWYMFFFQIPKLPEVYMRRDLRTFFYRGLRGWSHNKSAFTDEDIEEYVKAFQKPHALTGAVNYYRAVFRSLFSKHAPKRDKIKADTLLIWGEDDKALGKELTNNMEWYFENRFEKKYIADCSHWVQHEYPDRVNSYIKEFITS